MRNLIMLKQQLKLCLVTHRTHQTVDFYQQFIMQAVKGGVSMVQLRDKSSSLAEITDFAFQLQAQLEIMQIPLLINDYVEVAQKVNAAGVHLGQSDLSPMKARDQLGPEKIIGLSVESLDELKTANDLECIDYIACSAVFQSSTKLDCKKIWGLEGLESVVQHSKHPVMGIGGINPLNVGRVVKTGVAGVAVIDAIHGAFDPYQAAEQLRQCLEGETV